MNIEDKKELRWLLDEIRYTYLDGRGFGLKSSYKRQFDQKEWDIVKALTKDYSERISKYFRLEELE